MSTASALTDLIVETFRLNGELLSAGDELVADLGLTSARWQVLGAIAMSATALPVAHIARSMGLSRQAVQRVANELVAQGLMKFEANPHHQRAKFVVMTDKGNAAYEAAMARQLPWVNRLGEGLSPADIGTTLRVMRTMLDRLKELNHLNPMET